MFLISPRLKFRRLDSCWIVALCLSVSVVRAEITTDGTTGTAQTLTGPEFTIPENLGTRAGDNLFHSFERFNLANSERATFTGSDSINRVISRVTGGETSTINGLLRSEIGQADFYFINPAGVVFGDGAQVDVPASFYVSTADELRFADDTALSATDLSASTWSVETPESFGFLGDQTANIEVVQSELVLTPGRTLSLSSGDLTIDRSRIAVESGEVQLMVNGDAGAEVPIVGRPQHSAQGQLSINDSLIDVSGSDAGHIAIRSGDSVINFSEIFSDNIGSVNANRTPGIDIHTKSLELDNTTIVSSPHDIGQGSNITITASNNLNINNGSKIDSTSFGAGDAGDIIVNAGHVTIDKKNNENITGIINNTRSDHGNAGSIILNTGNILILSGGEIGSNNSRSISGNTGSITINTESLILDNQGSDFVTTISSSVQPNTSGKGGYIEINANAISLSGSSRISAHTFGSGDGGSISIITDQLELEGPRDNFGRPVIGSFTVLESGNAGSVTVNVKDTLTQTQGEINSFTFRSSGNAGNVAVNARSLTINGQGEGASIGSQTQIDSTGNSGNVTIKVEDILSLVDVAIISSSTFANSGIGNAGDVVVEAGQIIIDGRDNPSALGVNNNRATGIFSEAEQSTSGQTGNIRVTAPSISISNRGSISIISDPTIDNESLKNINPTTLSINTQHLDLSSNALISTESRGNTPAGSINLIEVDSLSLNASTISTEANDANGGDILISDASMVDLQGSQITTSVQGQGDGGDIRLDADVLVLDSGFIQANTAGANAMGGDIQIDTDALLTSRNHLQTAGIAPLDVQPDINVIQAAAPEGTPGIIQITSPQLNISGDLTQLESELLDLDQVARNPCTQPGTRQSTLMSLGYGGLPESPEQAGNATLNLIRLQQLLLLNSRKHHSKGQRADTVDTASTPLLVWKATTECQP